MRSSGVDASRRAFLGLSRGTIKDTKDSEGMQLADVDLHHDEQPTEVEHFLPYGFSFRPHPGAEVLTARLGGNASHEVVVLTTDRRHRFKDLKVGEVAVHDDRGQSVHLSSTGIHTKSPMKVVVEAPELHLGGEGGKPVARISDSTSDGATITTGSSQVFAVD